MTLSHANPEQYFAIHFLRLTGHEVFEWQKQLFAKLLNGHIPLLVDLPTGAGKTSVMLGRSSVLCGVRRRRKR
jgi:CRISPR/Cas system-associated endonuclease/helicase Cas3